MSALDGTVPMAGWALEGSVAMAYQNFGLGRIWYIESTWPYTVNTPLLRKQALARLLISRR